MEITINYWAVLVSALFSMILGFVWYGPLFGKTWMRISHVDPSDLEKRKEMQKSAGPLYAVQFILSLFQAYVLAHYIKGWTDVSGITNALWIWAAFIMPIIAQASMWNSDSAKVKWTRFLLQAGYQLILFIAMGIILGMWQ